MIIEAIKEKLYEWYHGHPRLYEEEADIICKLRFDPTLKHLNDREIQALIKIHIQDMYEEKFPKP